MELTNHSLYLELPLKTDTEKRVTDFLHIKFLLDGGTDSFTESFHLPPRSDRIRGFFYHIQRKWESGAGFVDLQSAQDPSTNTEVTMTGGGFDYFDLFLQKGASCFSSNISSIDLQRAEQGPFAKGTKIAPPKRLVRRWVNSDCRRNDPRKHNQF